MFPLWVAARADDNLARLQRSKVQDTPGDTVICWLARRGSPLIHLTGMTMVVMKLIFGRNDRFVAITKRGFLELPPWILSFGLCFPKTVDA